MPNRIGKWLNIYEDEIGLFLWSMLLLFLIRSSGIIFNNFAETAFLKRFGVEYLPIVYMLNSIATFIIMGIIAGVLVRLPGTRLLFYLLVFCGISVAGLRFLIPFGFDLIYPLLFVLKAQYEILLGLLFWNLANDLFNTRQSKRLFPLITAGGVLGEIIGSFITPLMAKLIYVDNLMLIYLGITILGALTVKALGSRFPTALIVDKTTASTKKGKQRTGIIEEIKKIIPLMKESTLVKILILMTFLPNLVVPIMNYQFNFAINQSFATESGMIAFFGYFRGFMNIISLFLLMFVGRTYGRLGLPVVLMFHPFNYILVFLAFLLRFDVFSAIYARMSTNILRTTFNKPATAVLMGLFPESQRAFMRTFLRGTVVRIGLLLSSGIILISETLFHPRYLSLVAIPVVAAWIMAAISLKRSYSNILLDLISTDMIDLKALTQADIKKLFVGGQIESQLVQAFLNSRGGRSLWYAHLLKSLGTKQLNQHLLSMLSRRRDSATIGLLELISSEAGKEAVHVLQDLATSEKNLETISAAISAANRLDPEIAAAFQYTSFLNREHPEIKANALLGLYRQAPEKYRSDIESLLQADDINHRKAGIIAAGGTKNAAFADMLENMLSAQENEPVLPEILRGLHGLEASENLNTLVLPYLSHDAKKVRETALAVIEIADDELLRKAIFMLDDAEETICELAKKKIQTASYQNTQLLVEALATPHRKIRKSIFDLLEALNIKDLDFFRFAQKQIQDGYQFLSDAISLEAFPENDARNLLTEHLQQKISLRIENVLRVLAAQDQSGQIKIICRGLSSADIRKHSNAMEALDSTMEHRLFKLMLPLMEVSSPREALKTGKKRFELIGLDAGKERFISYLLTYDDWVIVALTLELIQNMEYDQIDHHIIQKFTTSQNHYIRRTAEKIINQPHGSGGQYGG